MLPSSSRCGSLQTDAVRALADEKLHTMQLMVEQERRNVDSLRQDIALTDAESSSSRYAIKIQNTNSYTVLQIIIRPEFLRVSRPLLAARGRSSRPSSTRPSGGSTRCKSSSPLSERSRKITR